MSSILFSRGEGLGLLRLPCPGKCLVASALLSFGLLVAEATAARADADLVRAGSGLSGSGEFPQPDDLESETGTEEGGAEENAESLLTKGMEIVAEQHAAISNGIIASAGWIDSFFWDKRIEVEAQQTRLKLGFSLFAEHDTGVEYDGNANFRLSLPMLSERLQLQISGEGDDDLPLDPSRNRWQPRETREKGIMAGLRYFFTRTAKRNSSIKASLRLDEGTPVLLLTPRYRQDFPLDSWLLRFTQRVTGYSDGELDIRTIFNLERPLHEWPTEFFFRSTVEGIWYTDRSGYFYHVDFNLYQKLSPRRVLEYAVINEFRTVPSQRLETRLAFAYRQKVGCDWLFLEVAPQLSFPHERDRKPTPGILLKLEVIFGAYQYEDL